MLIILFGITVALLVCLLIFVTVKFGVKAKKDAEIKALQKDDGQADEVIILQEPCQKTNENVLSEDSIVPTQRLVISEIE